MMLTIDILRLAAMGLWRRKLRAALTVIGVVIGTMCIVIMISLGLTNIEQFNKDFLEGINLTEIRVSSGERTLTAGINQAEVNAFRRIQNVRSASGVLNIPVHVTYGDYEADLSVMAVDQSVLNGIRIKKGGDGFSSNAMPELLLGSEVLNQFHKSGENDQYNGDERETPEVHWFSKDFKLYLGEKPMKQEPLRVVSVQEEEAPVSKKYTGRVCGIIEASANSQYSWQAYMLLDVAKKLIHENRGVSRFYGIDSGEYMEVLIIADTMEDVASVMDQVKTMGYEAYSQAEMIESVKTEQVRQQGQLALIAAISLLVSAIGIANTMLTSILDRRKQIGVMKVVGLKMTNIRAIFLTEAALIGIVGGIIGIILSYVFAGLIGWSKRDSSILGMYFEDGTMLVMPFWLVLAALGISVSVGILSGIYPAIRSTKMSPLEAIRSGV